MCGSLTLFVALVAGQAAPGGPYVPTDGTHGSHGFMESMTGPGAGVLAIPGRPVLEPRCHVPNAFDQLFLPRAILPEPQEPCPPGCPDRCTTPIRNPRTLGSSPSYSGLQDITLGAPQGPLAPPALPLEPEPSPFLYHAVFKDPAHFPLWGFDRTQVSIAPNAAVLYEGMSVSLASKPGCYEVRFMMEAPRMPVTVRMQIGIYRGPTFLGTITLPPFTVQPDNNRQGYYGLEDLADQVPTKSWQFRHTGYSHLLLRVTPKTAGEFSFTRTGTARFGSLP
ncbi:MAG: hypothetical protein IT428_24400 [Planctomycetaceae bacterium]|nr:hypothetical protein [Planctomycetaceae bacterium]